MHAAGQYVRYEEDHPIHTYTIENVFLVFKRGMHGTYQHCEEAHLHRDLAEFDFRYNPRAKLGFTDGGRHEELLASIEGKRLTFRRIGETRIASAATKAD